jgi:wyosine [tRNA(Phe)-imidazoG37] synthetase (radical SAM superfamily)
MAQQPSEFKPSISNHDRLSDQGNLVYPVFSRRSGGLSLGINLNTDRGCNFDCVYCQVDRSTPPPALKPSIEQIETELRGWLDKLAQEEGNDHTLRDISLAGDGEPTSVKILPQVFRLLLDLKREYQLDETKLVLFTNGSGIDRKDLSSLWPELYGANFEVWFKLDYWDQDSLERINRTRLSFERLTEKLIEFGQTYPVILQSCFFRWQKEAFDCTTYQPYVQLVKSLLEKGAKIEKIQAYTLARKPTEDEAEPWSNAQMDQLASLLRSTLKQPVELFYETGNEE